MASTGVIKAVAKHIPLIRFPNRLAAAMQQHQPSSSSSSSKGGHAPKGSGYDDTALPLRFRRKPIEQVEIDYILRGGPE